MWVLCSKTQKWVKFEMKPYDNQKIMNKRSKNKKKERKKK